MAGPDPRAEDRAVARPTLTLFCGLPGAGKSTLARRLAAAGAGVRICTDEWQAAIGIPHADGNFHESLQRTLYGHALELLEHRVDVVLEDGLWMPHERAEKLTDARQRDARVVLHVLAVPVEVLWQRLEVRNRRAEAGHYPITRAELDRAAALFEPPTTAELAQFDEVHHHGDGSASIR